MVNTRKRVRKEESETIKVAKVKTEKKQSAKSTSKTVKVEGGDLSTSLDLNALNGLTVQQPFASAIIFGV